MTIGRKTTLALLGSVVALNVVLRYPSTGHEIGVDSYFIHALATSLAAHGFAGWVVNPLSYFGWYPLSYPSAGPFILASVSTTSSLGGEASVLFVSLVLGPLGILGAFLMARELNTGNLFALCTAFLYGTAPRFLDFTLWTGSSRNLFMAVLPIFVWALIRRRGRTSLPNITVLVSSVVILAAAHRLVALAFVVLIGFLAAAVLMVLLRIIRTSFPKVMLNIAFRRAGPYVAVAALGVIGAGMLVGTNVLDEYTAGELATGPQVQIQLLNLSASIARSVGVSVPFMIVGLYVLAKQRGKTVTELFFAVALIGLIPTLSLREYTGFYILPFTTTFAALGLVAVGNFLRGRWKVATRLFGAVLVVLILVFSAAVLNYEKQKSTTVSDETYGTSLFLLHAGVSDAVVANDGLTAVRFAAISGIAVLPVGGAGVTFQSPELLAYGYYNSADVANGLVRQGIGELTTDSDSIWTVAGVNAESDWVRILQSPYGDLPAPLVSRYHPAYYLEIKPAEGRYLAYDHVYQSELGSSLQVSGYRVYDDGFENLWWLGSPHLGTA